MYNCFRSYFNLSFHHHNNDHYLDTFPNLANSPLTHQNPSKPLFTFQKLTPYPQKTCIFAIGSPPK
jgi:hypothetical protein